MFIDEVTIEVHGGHGGDGCVSFRREKYVPRGGPDGGAGGPGGNIIFRADPAVVTLIDFRYRPHYRAMDGKHGKGKNQTGLTGKDTVCAVPVGTLVHDVAEGTVLADLDRPGAEFIAAAGGRGGRGNISFSSSRNPAPRRREKGLAGERRTLRLDLKLIADAGLVGLPNAGKSTLLTALTAARPKIAAYPFTTLAPMLGVMREPCTGESLTVADLPGLIAGAHRGKGLGLDFLKHLERTRVLVHLVELLPVETIADRYRAIREEVDCFGRELAAKPELTVITKTDLGTAAAVKRARSALARVAGKHLLAISAVAGAGVDELSERLTALVRAQPVPVPAAEPVRVITVKAEAAPIVKKLPDGRFRVEGSRLERRAAVTDFENEESLLVFAALLERSGVAEQLRVAGCRPGDTVLLGGVEFLYYDE